MLQTLFVYSLLLTLMLMFNATSVYMHSKGLLCIGRRQDGNVPILALLVFAFIFGIRYNVGIDHLDYLHHYESMRIFGVGIFDFEGGFALVTNLFAGANLHFAFYFAFLAFLQVFVLFYALREHYKVHSYIIITFILSAIFVVGFMNVIRHQIAFVFWVLAITFITKKQILPYFICIFLATSFHISSVLLIPFYFIYRYKRNFFENIKIQLLLLFGALFIMLTLNPVLLILESVEGLARLFGFGGYFGMIAAGDLRFLEPSRDRGIGFIVMLCINIILIVLSPKVKDYFKSSFLYIVYDLYFVGVLYLYLASGSLMLQRINIFFHNFYFIIAAFTLYYLAKNSSFKNKLLQYFLLLLFFLIFYAIIIFRGEESVAIYSTFWQNN